MMKLTFLLFLISFLSGCAGASPHSNPDSVTDSEIGIYKLGMKKGCNDQGLSKGDEPQKVEAVCQCALNLLETNLSHDQWREATFAAQHKDGMREGKILSPYLQQMRACSSGD
jgi:hypothetical protein